MGYAHMYLLKLVKVIHIVVAQMCHWPETHNQQIEYESFK